MWHTADNDWRHQSSFDKEATRTPSCKTIRPRSETIANRRVSLESHVIDETSGSLDTVASPMTNVPETEQVGSSVVGARGTVVHRVLNDSPRSVYSEGASTVANTLEASNGQVTAATYAALGNLNHRNNMDVFALTGLDAYYNIYEEQLWRISIAKENEYIEGMEFRGPQ
ncbi:hypothetical protein Tco_0509443 [Tanacetum coccineum]